MNIPERTPAQQQADIHAYALASGGRCGCDRCNPPQPANRREARAQAFHGTPFSVAETRRQVPTLRARTVRGPR